MSTCSFRAAFYDLCSQGDLPSNLLFTNAETGDTLATKETTSKDGKYSFVVTVGQNKPMTIKVVGRSEGYDPIDATIDIPATSTYKEITKDFPLGQQPALSWHADTADYIKTLPVTASEKYRKFHGLLIEKITTKELYPVLTYVFFDSASATIPDRYVLFDSPTQTQQFNDTKIPGGTMQKYRNVLNIVGYRLRQHPDLKVQITGFNSYLKGSNDDQGETMDVSKARGEVVYNYLKDIWQIDPSRLELQKPEGIPPREKRSNPTDPLGVVENRRAEINVVDPDGKDWPIVEPIVQTDVRGYPQPETMYFTMQNGINAELIKHRAIEIKRNGEMWYVMSGDAVDSTGVTQMRSADYNWGKDGVSYEDDPGAVPDDESPYTAQLVLYTKDGRECRSPEIQIPVLIIDDEIKRRERLEEKTIDRYSLVLFKFNSAEAGALNERILKNYIYNDIRQGARIDITGYTDVVGLEDRNKRLSEQRAETVESGIKHNVSSKIYHSLTTKGVGEESPLYSNQLPEGRFYNRTVQVVIETPTGQEEQP